MPFDADYSGVALQMQFGVRTARGRARAQSRLRCMDWILIFATISPNANTSRFEKRNANRIRFVRYGLVPGQKAAISIRFRGHDQGGRTTDTFAYRGKTALRRYLSEVRDNYVRRG